MTPSLSQLGLITLCCGAASPNSRCGGRISPTLFDSLDQCDNEGWQEKDFQVPSGVTPTLVSFFTLEGDSVDLLPASQMRVDLDQDFNNTGECYVMNDQIHSALELVSNELKKDLANFEFQSPRVHDVAMAAPSTYSHSGFLEVEELFPECDETHILKRKRTTPAILEELEKGEVDTEW